tara:strand:- start:70 stop:408 length:339 start_codon:yes stop_codon:yes gene_type:complete
MSFEDNIKKWVEYDTMIKMYSEKIKELKEKKNNVEDKIHDHINTYNKKPIINISDGVLKFSKVKIQQPLSYKLIDNSLNKIIKNDNQREIILNAIKESRMSKECQVIKRFYR